MSNFNQSEKDVLNSNETEESDHTVYTPALHSRWPYYWIYFSNWCFGLFTVSLVVEAVLVTKRYLKENKEFETSVELEIW